MKQVININFQGRIVPIEVTAYEILKQYIESLSRHFDAEEGKEEIINDIENRIGELFQERIKAGVTCIVDDDVNAIIKSIGRPEDFDDAEPSTNTENKNAQESANQQQAPFTTASGRRRLFRDENHKLVGGVCSGIANYFDIDIAIVRIIFAILFFTFGIGFIPYIILWIAVPSSATTIIGSRKKKLFRDTDEKYIAGVCSGIAHYFGINVWIPRLVFLLPLLSLFSRNRWLGHYGDFSDFVSVSPGALFIYIILWIVLPEAKSTAEKLEMKGEKVDMNSIKESVVEEMKGVQQRVQKFGKEAASLAGEKGKAFGSEASAVARKSGRSLGDIIVILVKAFVYIVLGVVALFLVVAMFTLGIASFSVIPLKDFIFNSGWQNALAWGTLIFFILVPMIGVITWIIRKITKVKTGSKMLRLGFIAMWVVGWVCVSFLGASISKDFNYSSNLNAQEVSLLNPSVNALEITTLKSNTNNYRNNWFRNDVFNLSSDDNNATVRNVTVHIVKATSDSFKVTTLKYACGRREMYADSLANLIVFNAQQKDSTLVLDRGIAINTKDKFRNQRVIVTIYVPIGKRIKVQNNIGWLSQISFNGGIGIQNSNYENLEFDNIETGWITGVWYTMTKEGLVTQDGKAANGYRKSGVKINDNGIDVRDGKNRVRINENGISVDENEDDENTRVDETGTYRYDDKTPLNKVDSIKMNLKKEEKRFKDSLEEEKKKIDKQLDKYNNKETALLYNVLPSNLLMRFLN